MIGSAALIGYFTLGQAYLQHRRVLPLALLTAGLLVMFGAHFLLPHHAGTIPSIAGALLLVAAQVLNRRKRACMSPGCTHHS